MLTVMINSLTQTGRIHPYRPFQGIYVFYFTQGCHDYFLFRGYVQRKISGKRYRQAAIIDNRSALNEGGGYIFN